MTAPGLSIVERFESYVRRDPDGHWRWTGATSHGYGALAVGRKNEGTILAHVLSYELHVGPVPDGLVLDHLYLCRIKLCVNPDHLEPVTQAENCRRGAKAKLTMADAQEIRVLFAIGFTQRVLAELFDTSPAYISAIVRGKRWSPVAKPIQRRLHVNPFIARHRRDQLGQAV